MEVSKMLSVGKLAEIKAKGISVESGPLYTFQIIKRGGRILKIDGERRPIIYIILSDSVETCSVVLGKILQPYSKESKKLDSFNLIDVKTVIKNPETNMLELTAYENLKVFSTRIGEQIAEPVSNVANKPVRAKVTGERSMSARKYVAIEDLNTYNTPRDISIRGRVTGREDLKVRTNNKPVFSFIISDSKHSIKVVSWNDVAEKFHRIVQMDRGYIISGFDVKRVDDAGRAFNPTGHICELRLGYNTVIVDDPDAASIEIREKDYTQIINIPSMENNVMINVKGVVLDIDSIRNVVSKGETKKTRIISVTDKSGYMIQLKLWQEAAMLPLEKFEVYHFDHVRVGRYGGLILNSYGGSVIRKDESPDIRSWWKNLGKKMKLKSVRELFDGISCNAAITCLDVMTLIKHKPDDLPYNFSGIYRIMRTIGTSWYANCSAFNCRRRLHMSNPSEKRVQCLECQAITNAPTIDYSATVCFGDYTGQFEAVMYTNAISEMFSELSADVHSNMVILDDILLKRKFNAFHVQAKLDHDRRSGLSITVTGLASCTTEVLTNYYSNVTRRPILPDEEHATVFYNFWSNNGDAILPVRLSDIISEGSDKFLTGAKHNIMTFVAMLEGICTEGAKTNFELSDGDDLFLQLSDPFGKIKITEQDVGSYVEVFIQYRENCEGVNPFILAAMIIITGDDVKSIDDNRIRMLAHLEGMDATYRHMRTEPHTSNRSYMDVDLLLSPKMKNLGTDDGPPAKRSKW